MWIIRASALGGCMRSLIAAGRDVEPTATPDWLQAKFDEGHAGEREIAKWYYQKTGHTRFDGQAAYADYMKPSLVWIPDDDQWEFNLRVAPNVIVRGHFDDIVINPRPRGGDNVDVDFLGVEYKLLAPSTYAKATGSAHLDVLPTYPWQMGCYIAASGFYFDWVTVEKNEDGTPNLERTDITRLNDPPRTLKEITARATEVIDWIENRAYDEYPACDVEQYPCPYFLLHDEEVVEELADGPEAAAMERALDMLDSVKWHENEAKRIKSDAHGLIKETLGERKTVGLNGTRITWVHTETPAQMVTPKPYMKKASVTDYPKITPPKKAKEEA